MLLDFHERHMLWQNVLYCMIWYVNISYNKSSYHHIIYHTGSLLIGHTILDAHDITNTAVCNVPSRISRQMRQISRYSPYHGYRRYSGIFNYRRCLSGVWQKPFQIEDITRFQSSSNDQKSKNKPFNLGMICAISSICFFCPTAIFCCFSRQII